MQNVNRKESHSRNFNSYVDKERKWKIKKGDVHDLMQRLKKNEQKKNKEKFFFVISAIGFLIISGVIFSF